MDDPPPRRSLDSTMLLGILCVSLCGEAVLGRHQITKSALTAGHRGSAGRNVRSNAGWRETHDRAGVVRAAWPHFSRDAPGTRSAGVSQAPGGPAGSFGEEGARRAARKRTAPDGKTPERADAAPAAMATDSGGRGYPRPSVGGAGGQLHGNETARRRRVRDVESPRGVDAGFPTWETPPEPAAQVEYESTDPPFNETTDYEEFTRPDLRDLTPLVPVNTRTRRKQVRNPFYPLSAEAYGAYAVVIIAAIIFTVGIIGNIAIMCIVCHNYYMRSISNSLLANLALWDFVVIFFCLPLVVFHELTKTWLLGEFSCRIIPYLEVASLGVTTFTLCALCIDRFRAATNVQMYYEMIENCASTSAKLAVIWVGALLLALPELLIRQLVTEEGESPGVAPCERCTVRISTELPDTLYVLGLTYDGARLWWYFGCYFCLPTLFTICSSLVTARKIRRAEKACVRGSKKQIQLESQMNCTVVALAILYGFCIIPENICNIVVVYMAASVPRRALDVLHLLSQMLLFCKSAVTPVLLFGLCRPFTRAVLDCCCCCCEECGPPASSATATTSDNEATTAELELSPFSTIREEASTYSAVGTHC